ncbi:D-alanyl-D-alanine carboxypeptidase [Microbacterium sp. STN6]|uniref:D-alanyl-D-alanine carboxypeptidase family protein n=1 Tax=Microbacterium sp. STN6 TaxID=2995588 RepID=UPI002260B248|nr:D-alanyl-D-alanine carboxypeptidase [Microbacterium sp. STN6]MCX7521591.1 D-alanyl-D-alanine carboxypeptidase [Microbacterium sp. STN6]
MPNPPSRSETRSETRSATRRRLYRRRRLAVFGGILAVLAIVGYTVGVQAAPIPASAATVGAQTTITQAPAQLDWPKTGAAAVGAVGYEGTLGTSGSAASVPIASITKTITALVVLDEKPLTSATDPGPSITFTNNDVAILKSVITAGGSWASVTAGSTMTERQALEAMLLPSANNYAISLAGWAYGSVPAYVTAANAWLAAHHLSGTHVADASGLNPGSVSTPGDLVEIAKLVMSDAALPSIVDTVSADLPGSGVQENSNTLLGTLGIDGIKTGTTTQAGYCLMFSSTLTLGAHAVTIVGVVLGATGESELHSSVLSLVKSARAGFHEVTLTGAGHTFGDYATAWGSSAQLVAAKPASLLVWSDTPITVDVTTQPVREAASGATVGAATFTLGSEVVRRSLTLSGDVEGPDLWWRLTNPAALR